MLVWVHTDNGRACIDTNALVIESLVPFDLWPNRSGIDYLSDHAMYEHYVERIIHRTAADALTRVYTLFRPVDYQQSMLCYNLGVLMDTWKAGRVITDGKVICDAQNNTPFVNCHGGLVVTLAWQFTPLKEHHCIISNLEFLS